ncbi:MAG TPA: SRPBCC family protein [Solirubrobacteraceae bacterium]|jgi:ribosome-associated toxin RatA of RatAB toxin-antitoxin module
MANLGGRASTEVDAPLDACWALAEDVAAAPQWQNGLEEMNVRERDAQGRVLVAESVSDAKVRKVKTLVRFSYDEPHRVSWRQEKGDLKSLDGAWELEDLGGGRTRVTYSLDGDPGRMLGMLIRGPVEGRIREVLVNGRPGEFKARVEGG